MERKKVVGFLLFFVGLYIISLLVTSITSDERTLGLNEAKHFCGFYLECHMYVSVTGAEKTKTIGEGRDQKTARGLYYIVNVKVGNDAKRAAISLLEPVAEVVDEQGNEFERARDAEALLKRIKPETASLSETIEPNSYKTAQLVFDLTENIGKPSLLITEGIWVDRFIEFFLIGDEDSLLHKKTIMRLE